MAKKIVIIGAVALGPKVACRLRRLDPEAEITLIDRDDLISYGGCGIPYYVGGDVNDLEDLYSTTSHAIRDVNFFRDCKGIKVLTQVEALEIDRVSQFLRVNNLSTNEEAIFEYDKLVLATGAKAVRPPFPGVDLPGVFTVSDLHDAEQIKSLMTQGKVGKAVVIGAGAIGLELSEALTDLWGIETTLIEMEDQVLPTLLGKCIARLVASQLRSQGVNLLLSEKVMQITPGPTEIPITWRRHVIPLRPILLFSRLASGQTTSSPSRRELPADNLAAFWWTGGSGQTIQISMPAETVSS